MQTDAEAHPVGDTANRAFRPGVVPFDVCHHFASMPVVHGVHHDIRPGFGLGSVKWNRHIPGTNLIMRHLPTTES